MLCLLSNVTVEGPFLKNTVAKLCQTPVHTTSGYDTWMGDLLRADFDGVDPEAVFLIVDGDALLDGDCLHEKATLDSRLAASLDVIGAFARSHPEIPLFVSSIDVRQRAVMPLNGKRLEAHAMAAWRDGLEALGIPVLELAEIAADMGRERFYDIRTWYMGKMPFSMSGQKAIAGEIRRAWNALKGRIRKCVAVDLDNTLWGGIIGEDGIDGIKLSAEDGGEPYRDFQRRLLDLKNLGALLAVVSKNNSEDALAGLKHPAMILRESDFVAIMANWQPKVVNLQELAKSLNIGLDSFVFIDDNPVEREAVKITLPEVAVPDFPDEPEKLPELAGMVAKTYFSKVDVTGEDLKKTKMYQEAAERASAETAFARYEDYLASLKMRMTILPLAEADVSRAAQLTQKTNQFNLTTRRYTSGEVRKLMQSGDWRLWTARMSDRFGDFGLSLYCMVCVDRDTARIDTLLMSCRVMGRGLEFAFLHELEKRLERDGIKTIGGMYIESPKNSPARDFLSEAGYAAAGQPEPGSTVFTKSAPFTCRQTFVEVTMDE